MGYAAQAATLVGLITGVASLIFLVRPELQPTPSTRPTRDAATLKPLVARLGVSRAQYLDLTNQSKTGFTPLQLAKTGVFLRFHVTIRGFEGIPITLRQELFDVRSGRKLSENSSITITPPKSAIERDWHAWEPLPEPRRPFFVLIKLTAENEDAPLATLQTRDFKP